MQLHFRSVDGRLPGRYDVHVTSGGLGLTQSMNFFSSAAFKVHPCKLVSDTEGQQFCLQAYLAVPFVEEMRVLTDWTVTRQRLFAGLYADI